MKIAIDCRYAGNSGIGTFLENILPYIVRHSEVNFLLIGDETYLSKYRERENCEILHCYIRPFSLKGQLGFPTRYVNKCELFFTPNFDIPLGIHIPVFSTIHDVVFFDYPQYYSPLYRLILRAFMVRAINKSVKVFTVSSFSKERIVFHFQNGEKIKVVSNGVKSQLISYACNHKSDEIKKKEGVVFLGNLKCYKGVETLVEAFNELQSRGIRKTLTIIGNINFRTRDNKLISKIQSLKSSIRFKSNASDKEVFDIISQSEVLVSPSLYEGFGIPPLEALYLGTNVIISDIPVYKEIYKGLPVTYFQAGNPIDLAKKIHCHPKYSLHIQKKILSLYNYEKTAQLIFKNFFVNV